MTLRPFLLSVLSCVPLLAAAAVPEGTPQTQSPALVAALPACTADDLSLDLDSENGLFNGMQHSGALLVLRNIGPQACRLPRLPNVGFVDANGKTLSVVRAQPTGMHPGPVEMPIGLAVGAEATTALYWVDGNAYSDGHCDQATTATVTIGKDTLSQHVVARFCGPAGQPATFRQPPLALDRVLVPSAAKHDAG